MDSSEEYAQRFPHLQFTRWTTGAMASQAGFGCYRINTHNVHHEQALHRALASGINVIDTSANYGDGSAEELIGKVLADVQTHSGITREDLIVVSKAGYMQGRNYHRAHKREHLGNAFPHVVKFGEGLWHCIHPEFLEDQITRSIRHMNTPYVDVYLLHNPEYFLIHAQREEIPLEEARAEFYYRIKLAFEHLEKEVASGRIKHYGISSNCFAHPAHADDFVSLERCLEIAEEVAGANHRFKVAQLPFNLLETNAATELNQNGNTQTFLEYAQEHDITVMVNRVLNAITQNSLIRLAEHAFAGTPAPSESDIAALIGDCVKHEDDMLQRILPTLPFEEHSKETLADFLSPGLHLVHHWDKFESVEHWHDVQMQYLQPRMNEAIEAILHHPVEGMDDWIRAFKLVTKDAFKAITHFYAVKAQPRLTLIREKAVSVFGEKFNDMTIAQLAFNAPRATVGVHCTLIGARREQYVDEVIQSLQSPMPALTREHWEQLAGLEQVV
ncbi:MAG: aldo/keto reductase [Bacteriodetes bacterium]|nr:aldo/keto reductase [Bacteroidota bacterium]